MTEKEKVIQTVEKILYFFDDDQGELNRVLKYIKSCQQPQVGTFAWALMQDKPVRCDEMTEGECFDWGMFGILTTYVHGKESSLAIIDKSYRDSKTWKIYEPIEYHGWQPARDDMKNNKAIWMFNGVKYRITENILQHNTQGFWESCMFSLIYEDSREWHKANDSEVK